MKRCRSQGEGECLFERALRRGRCCPRVSVEPRWSQNSTEHISPLGGFPHTLRGIHLSLLPQDFHPAGRAQRLPTEARRGHLALRMKRETETELDYVQVLVQRRRESGAAELRDPKGFLLHSTDLVPVFGLLASHLMLKVLFSPLQSNSSPFAQKVQFVLGGVDAN